MKISLTWLQNYFETPLPSAEKIADAYTFHAFEIEESAGDMMDVKVLPNRSADCLSHRGLAIELSAILHLSFKADPLRTPLTEYPKTDALSVIIEDPQKCSRYMGAVVKGVKIGPSPEWLKKALEAVGQRSINNVVDATNYVMLNIGQPLHAFDAKKLMGEDGSYSIGVRSAKAGEKITTLSNETYELVSSIQVITDANADTPIALAGIKGGKHAEVTSDTTDLIIESANFDGTTTRRAAQKLKLFTDASMRFQNRPSSELAAYGMRDVLALITEIAGGEVVGVVDEYPVHPSTERNVSVSLSQINNVLGSNFSPKEVATVFDWLALPYVLTNDVFTIMPHFERTDLVIPEDLIEEVGRIIGYDKIAAAELPSLEGVPDQARFHGIEKMKDELVEQGYIEVSTQSFAAKGDIYLANPLDKAKPALRTTLEGNLSEALAQAKYVAPLVLEPKQKPMLFEIGNVFSKSSEYLELRTTPTAASVKEGDLSKMNLEEYGKDYTPKRYELGAYTPFSVYPFIARDIALWVPKDTDEVSVKTLITEHAGDLLIRIDQFDRFEKEGRVSLAYRLVFQSFNKTLTDEEIHDVMKKVSDALTAKGYEVR